MTCQKFAGNEMPLSTFLCLDRSPFLCRPWDLHTHIPLFMCTHWHLLHLLSGWAKDVPVVLSGCQVWAIVCVSSSGYLWVFLFIYPAAAASCIRNIRHLINGESPAPREGEVETYSQTNSGPCNSLLCNLGKQKQQLLFDRMDPTWRYNVNKCLKLEVNYRL